MPAAPGVSHLFRILLLSPPMEIDFRVQMVSIVSNMAGAFRVQDAAARAAVFGTSLKFVLALQAQALSHLTCPFNSALIKFHSYLGYWYQWNPRDHKLKLCNHTGLCATTRAINSLNWFGWTMYANHFLWRPLETLICLLTNIVTLSRWRINSELFLILFML